MYGDQGVKTAAYEVAEAIKEAAQTGRFSLVMLAGDFSYADGVSAVWDEWGRMVEPYAQSIPVMVRRASILSGVVVVCFYQVAMFMYFHTCTLSRSS